MSSLYLSTEQQGDVTVARILWEKVSTREAEILQPELLAAAQSPMRLVIDLTAVQMLASPGLGMLITMHKRAQESGGRMVVTGLSPALMEVLTLTHLHKFFRIEGTIEAAVKKVAG
jgi:anti-sigma B factor antagonist